jgi:adenine-specific DNA-methyltransferase
MLWPSQQATLTSKDALIPMLPRNFDEAFARAKRLVETFRRNEPHYLAPGYSEAQARVDFIDEFWVALGWDVRHVEQTNPYEQEVKVEKSVQVSASRKRADYAFHLAPRFGDVRFYVEAKKPFVDVDNADDYFQTIRYGWNSQTPLSVLTDFQTLRVLDCRYKPDPATALERAVRKYHYEDYADAEKFREIYYLFSREAVAAGSIENFAAAHLAAPSRKAKSRKLFATGGWQSIDESFLAELDQYREEFARAFKNRNPALDSRQLTEITQRTLDRLVFMRFLEDKLIETEPLVENFGAHGSAWGDFIAASARLDKIYNGIIFKRHALLDAPTLQADERAFTAVCDKLSHANSPYDFNAIPIHILGSIYERFLGKTIIASDKRARIEEKPEVRKAGGVYYTPEYIVRYIVAETVGKLIAGKSPEGIRSLRFADIACGSGSFLLGVYDLLLGYHTGYYNANQRNRARGRKAGCLEDEEGRLRLSLRQKGEILLNNVYGVDIDAQAVEVAQLSLYLKMLEDETPASARNYQQSFKAALLPSLSQNIVCGNSLIDYDVLDGRLFDREEEYRLNPMSFDGAFPQVMREGRFDAIVGNPPYGAEIQRTAAEYLRAKYRTVTANFDTYALFMERALQLLKPSGKLSMIVPTGWYSGAKFASLRKVVGTSTDPDAFVNLPYDIFSAWVDTTIFVAEKRIQLAHWPRTESCKVRIRTFPKRHKIASQEEFYDDLSEVNFAEWFSEGADEYLTYADSATTKLIWKINKNSLPLGAVADVQRGVTPFNLDEKPLYATSRRAFSGTVRRYTIEQDLARYIRFDESLAELKPERYFVGPRILLRELISRQFQLQAVKTAENFVTNKSMQSILSLPDGPHLNYLLGLINSRLMSWYFLKISNVAQRDDFPKIVLKETRQLPIAKLDTTTAKDGVCHERIVHLVEQMLEAKQQLASATMDRDRLYQERKVAALDAQIDRLVYELYELTPDEIALVEAATRK